MIGAEIVLGLGYASLLLELLVFAVPSVASTWQQMGARPSRRWAALHVLPTAFAVAGFVWPGALALAARTGLVEFPRSADSLAWVGVVAVVLGRALTLHAVAALRCNREQFTAAGPYRLCRNPALLGLHVFLLGAIAIVPAWHTALGALAFMLHMHRRVRCEERHLAATAGDSYLAYCARVPRYVPVPTGCRRVPR